MKSNKLFSITAEKPNVAFLLVSCFLISIVFFRFIFLHNYLLYTDIGNDSYYQVYAYIKAINLQLKETHELGWSFMFGTGQPISGIFASNIFIFPLFFIDEAFIPYGMVLTEVLKVVLIGWVFFNYLKIKHYTPLICLFGGCAVMLSGFIMINASWYSYFSYAGLLLVLWLFSLEKLKQHTITWLALTTALLLMDQPFHLYLFVLFTGVYFFIDDTYLTNWKVITIRFILAILLGVSLSAIVLGTNIQTIINSPRYDNQFSFFKQLYNTPIFQLLSFQDLKTVFLRFFSNNIQGIASYYTGSGIYIEAPMLFLSQCSVLLLSQFLDRKSKTKIILPLSVILGILIFPFFRYALWLFTGNYHRIVGFAIALLAFEYSLGIIDKLSKGQIKINNKLLTINFVGIVLAFIIFSNDNINFYYFKSILFCSVLFIILRYLKYSKTQTAIVLIVLISIIDSTIEAYSTINFRHSLTQKDLQSKKGFNDYSLDAVNWIKAQDRTFYRIEKDYSAGDALQLYSVNDAMIQGYNGLRIFTSFNHMSYVKYLMALDGLEKIDERNTRWLYTRMDRFEILDNLAVKYIISDGIFDWKQLGCKLIKSFGKIRVFYNPNYVPMGSLFGNVITQTDFANLSLKEKKQIIKTYVVVPDIELEEILALNSQNPPLASDLSNDKSLKIKNYSHNSFEGSIFSKEVALMYFSIPYDRGWTVKVDGTETEKIIANNGMTAILLKPGSHSISLNYQLPYRNLLLIWTVLGLCVFIVSTFNLKNIYRSNFKNYEKYN